MTFIKVPTRLSMFLFAVPLFFLLSSSRAHAECSSTMLVEDPYIEITSCIVGDTSEVDAYADASSSESENIFLQVQLYSPDGEVDGPIGCGYMSASASNTMSPAPSGGYQSYAIYAGDGPDWDVYPYDWGGTCGETEMLGDTGPEVNAEIY